MYSVTADTPILVRRIEDIWVDFIEFCELMPPSQRLDIKRTYSHVKYEVLTHAGWQQPTLLTQSKSTDPIIRVTDERGTICVLDRDNVFCEPRDVYSDGELDHLDPAGLPSNTIAPVTAEYAEVLGFFAAEGTAGKMTRGEHKGSNGYFWTISNKNRPLLERYAKVLESVHARRFIFILDKREVWKVCPTACSDVAPWYMDHFYTETGKKRIPKFILNAPKEIIRAFLDGYEKGDGHVTIHGTQSLTTNSMTLAAGLFFLYDKLGQCFGFQGKREDKPSIIQLYERKHGMEMLKRPPGIRHVQRDEKFDGFVFGLNTKAGTFVAGPGLFLLQNSLLTDLNRAAA